MDDSVFEKLSEKFLKKNYATMGQQALSSHSSKIKVLIEQGRCPDIGWDDSTIEMLLQNIALMDSNNFMGCAQLGERESRFASEIVRRRHFRMGHGIGRSGDILEQQPKAAGSTLMNHLTNSMLLHVLHVSGAPNTKKCFVTPMATGMSLVLCLSAFRRTKPGARFVVWPRIDQKSCFKCILTAGFEPLIVEGRLQENGELRTDIDGIRQRIEETGAENILAILSTTSCFAPRSPDDIVKIAGVCRQFNLFHLVNNAYGVQSTKCMARLEQASRTGRVDAFVQSTDKNFMVPVGGAVIAGFDRHTVEQIAQTYPGRGSGSPTMDVFVTLLSLGIKGYRDICKQRQETFLYLTEQLEELASAHDQKVLRATSNDISIGFTLNGLAEPNDVTAIGSMLFTRYVFGTRTVIPRIEKSVEGHSLMGWGSHCNDYPHNYLTAAVSVGTTVEDVDTFIEKLSRILSKRRQSRPDSKSPCDSHRVLLGPTSSQIRRTNDPIRRR